MARSKISRTRHLEPPCRIVTHQDPDQDPVTCRSKLTCCILLPYDLDESEILTKGLYLQISCDTKSWNYVKTSQVLSISSILFMNNPLHQFQRVHITFAIHNPIAYVISNTSQGPFAFSMFEIYLYLLIYSSKNKQNMSQAFLNARLSDHLRTECLELLLLWS